MIYVCTIYIQVDVTRIPWYNPVSRVLAFSWRFPVIANTSHDRWSMVKHTVCRSVSTRIDSDACMSITILPPNLWPVADLECVWQGLNEFHSLTKDRIHAESVRPPAKA